jgi:hypothetical protein
MTTMTRTVEVPCSEPGCTKKTEAPASPAVNASYYIGDTVEHGWAVPNERGMSPGATFTMVWGTCPTHRKVPVGPGTKGTAGFVVII